MADVTVKRFSELESYNNEGRFLRASRGLGVSAWGMNILELPPNWPDYPEHDEASDGQEEVYMVLKGSAKLEAGGQAWTLEPGMMARVGPTEKRKLTPGASGATVLALGGTPGKPYTAPNW
jgi:uncharacterized cupin superfamily protein